MIVYCWKEKEADCCMKFPRNASARKAVVVCRWQKKRRWINAEMSTSPRKSLPYNHTINYEQTYLSPSSTRTHGRHFNVVLFNLNIDFITLGHNSHRCRRSMHSPLRFGRGNPLYPMHTRFPFHFGIHLVAFDIEHHIFKTTIVSRGRIHNSSRPALAGAKLLVDIKEVSW